MKKIKHAIKKEGSALKREFQEKTIGYILAALGLVAGLSWNDFIKSFIEKTFPIETSANVLWAKLIYAVLTTLIVVVISLYLTRLFVKKEEK